MMKNLLTGLFCVVSIQGFASTADFQAKCFRADGGEAPIITYSSDKYSNHRIILNDGSNIGWGDEGFDVSYRMKGSKYQIKGAVSGILKLRNEFKSSTDVTFKFDLKNKEIVSFLKSNTNLLKRKTNRVKFKCHVLNFAAN